MKKRVIEVFVKNQEVPVRTFQTYEFSTPGHPCTKKPIVAPVLESVLPEAHEQAIEVAERVAEEKNLKLKVYNISSRMGKIKAFLKRVNKTPTIIIQDRKISEEITEDNILSLLE